QSDLEYEEQKQLTLF
ncbi:TPA: hypothetical protein OZN45_002866, partial [Staphylococcus aureus]|nr:hypothetical protein [Staphylococcus aureus]HCX2125549.1 hypothetical protein [Staphylococcus aureus]HCX2554201.1 hypothetical protein [Staphylococcus aureus]HCX3015083.1 hypothetical protein [Staphylococcus aureus]HCX3072892.1 hypothetical protein [Staphylococcus aureus]